MSEYHDPTNGETSVLINGSIFDLFVTESQSPVLKRNGIDVSNLSETDVVFAGGSKARIKTDVMGLARIKIGEITVGIVFCWDGEVRLIPSAVYNTAVTSFPSAVSEVSWTDNRVSVGGLGRMVDVDLNTLHMTLKEDEEGSSWVARGCKGDF